MGDQLETTQPRSTPAGAAGPAVVVERTARLFPDSSLRAALLATPNPSQWRRTGAFHRYQPAGGKPPQMIVVALTDSELVLLDAHVPRGRTALGDRFSRWAAWPIRSLKVDVGHARTLPMLTIAIVDADELFVLTFYTGLAYRGNREAADAIEAAVEPLFPEPREEDGYLPPVQYDPKDRILL
jgi:hypothetical protein